MIFAVAYEELKCLPSKDLLKLVGAPALVVVCTLLELFPASKPSAILAIPSLFTSGEQLRR